jgi:LacI family transcriptional regulator
LPGLPLPRQGVDCLTDEPAGGEQGIIREPHAGFEASRQPNRMCVSRAGGDRLSVRLKDIARDLGISPMAVWKALHDRKDIGKDTKERVRRRAAELNYQVDGAARSLVTGRSFLVGLVIPDLKQSFFAAIAAAVETTLAAAGYHLLISHNHENSAAETTNIEQLVARKVDGLIIASAQREPRTLAALQIPYVLIDRRIAGLKANFVGTRNEEIGFLATEHLIQQGCRRIAHLRGPRLQGSSDRLQGYRRALDKHGVKYRADRVVDAGDDDRTGYAAMRALLAQKPLPDGVFCFNDPIAVGAMRAVLGAGLAIPGDVAMVGVANMHYAELLTVPLSTVDQDTARIGTGAAHRLLEGMPAKRRRAVAAELFIEPRLIVRASSQRRS